MSKFLVPNTFIPGTKAKAQDINANFTAIQDEINKKASKTGDSLQQFLVANATENNHAITKKQIQDLLDENSDEISKKFLTQGLVKSGYIDENGNPAILSTDENEVLLLFNVDDGTSYAPIVAVPANNKSEIFIENLESIDISSYISGTYNVFVNANKEAVLNPNFQVEQDELLIQQRKLEIQSQLEELDKKRIRAICEPSMRTETQSWLEYYNEQVKNLRQVMAEL